MLNQTSPETFSERSMRPEGNSAAASAIEDICAGFAKWRIWTALSWQEYRNTYRRSVLGVVWVTLSFAAFMFLKLTLFSSLLGVDDNTYYSAYLLLGYFIWFYISQSITSAPETFLRNRGWIRSEPLPMSTYIFKSILREIYNLLLTLIVIVIALYMMKYPKDFSLIVFSFIAILFFFLSAFSLKLLLGTISARFRDVIHLVRAIMMPMMFLSPIFWMPSQMAPLMKYLWWNPLFHYIEIFRAPILDGVIPVTSWIFVGIVYGVITVAAFVLFAFSKRRIVFWL